MTVPHQTVVDTLLALAEEDPERTNPSIPDGVDGMETTCVYTSEDGAHCIAAEVITRLGGRVPEWGHPLNGKALNVLLRRVRQEEAEVFDVGLIFPDESISLLTTAQILADANMAWGRVVPRALEAETR